MIAIACLAFGSALAAEVQLTDSVLRVDGLVVADALRSKGGPGQATLTIARDGAPVLQVDRVKGREGEFLLTVTLHPELDRFQGNFRTDESGLVADLVHEGVLELGMIDRRAFGRFADDRGLTLSNLKDLERALAVDLANRCPRSARLKVSSDRGTGRTVSWTHHQAAQSASRLDLLAGDQICLDHPSGACVRVPPGMAEVAVSADCAALVLP